MNTCRQLTLPPRAERFLKGAFVAPSSKVSRRAALDHPPKTALRAMLRDVEQAASKLGSESLDGMVTEIMSLTRREAAACRVKAIEVPTSTASSSSFHLRPSC